MECRRRREPRYKLLSATLVSSNLFDLFQANLRFRTQVGSPISNRSEISFIFTKVRNKFSERDALRVIIASIFHSYDSNKDKLVENNA